MPAWWDPPLLPTSKGRRPHLIVSISEATLNGQNDDPADLAGYGPIPVAAGRRIAEQAGTRTTVHLPRPPGRRPPDLGAAHGQQPPGSHGQRDSAAEHRTSDGAAYCTETGCGTNGYRPGQALIVAVIDAVIATYPVCQAPGCTRPSTHCDLDHVIPHRHGGRTCLHNLRPLCRRHHRLKTHARWRRTRAEQGAAEQGAVIWTTRLGRRYVVPPPDQPGSPDW